MLQNQIGGLKHLVENKKCLQYFVVFLDNLKTDCYLSNG